MRKILSIATLLFLLAPFSLAGGNRDPLTPAEVDKLREVTQEPEKRIKLFIEFARARLLAVEQLRADPKLATDRGKQIHNLLTDFLSISESLEDNLEMYERQHADLRNPLKQTIEAYTDWKLRLRNLKEPPKGDAKAAEELKEYDFVLESAVDSVNGALDSSRELLQEQNKQKEDEKHKKK
jgi:hypothetical protein